MMKKALPFLFVLLYTAALHPQAQTVPDDAEPVTYYVTLTGKKYHVRDCWSLRRSKTLKLISHDKAVKQGYTPCSICIKAGKSGHAAH